MFLHLKSDNINYIKNFYVCLKTYIVGYVKKYHLLSRYLLFACTIPREKETKGVQEL